jgi:hypothetical protein
MDRAINSGGYVALERRHEEGRIRLARDLTDVRNDAVLGFLNAHEEPKLGWLMRLPRRRI